jgi:quercetin 2,3-dioxygenase
VLAAERPRRNIGTAAAVAEAMTEHHLVLAATGAIDVRRAAQRFHTKLSWLDSWHSFSFSSHYDAANTNHGLLLVHNDDVVSGGGGFGTHPHRDMEIVTWVLSGELVHRDSEGNHGVLYPGLAQRMSAGTGIRHSEHNGSATADVHFLQMWVLPDTTGIAPDYQQVDVNDELDRGGLVLVAAGAGRADTGDAGDTGDTGGAAITIHQRDARLWVGRLHAGETVPVPTAPHTHLFVAVGDAMLRPAGGDGGGAAALARGDAARLTEHTNPGSLDLVAGAEGAEVVIWATA